MAAAGKIKSIASHLIRFGIGAMFVYAGALKAWNPKEFQGAIHGYKMLPHILEVLLALYLPWIEIVCGVCLIAKRWYVGAVSILLLLSAVFIAAIAQAWQRGLDISCGCFGADTSKADYPLHLLGDGVLLGLLLFLLIQAWKTNKPAPLSAPEPITT